MVPGFKSQRLFGLLACLLVMLGSCTDRNAATFQGYVEGEFVYVASAEAGRLDQLLVSQGQQILAGAPLFILESESEAAALRQAQQQLSAAEAQFQDLTEGKRPQELAVIRAQLAQAAAAEKKSAAELTRDEAQYRAGGISRAQLDGARAEAETNTARMHELESQLEVAELPARGEQIKAQSAVASAAQAALEQAQWKLNQKSVSSVQAGLVFDTLYRVGEWVPSGRPVVRLLPPGNIKVRFFVPEPLAGSISIGQRVLVRWDGSRSGLPATVTYISGEAEYTPPVIYSNETRSKLVFMIEARPAVEQAAGLHPGQPVEVAWAKAQ